MQKKNKPQQPLFNYIKSKKPDKEMKGPLDNEVIKREAFKRCATAETLNVFVFTS